MSEPPAADHPTASIPDQPAPSEPHADDPEQSSEPDAVIAADRLFGAFALGVMALLVICVVLAIVASRNAPAGF